jgi:Putative DNA-binding domain
MLFTPLHRLLGEAPGPITNEMIDAAVAVHLAETDDLDWKGELPPTKGLSEHDFVKDVAAMANSGGGVLVYGVAEVQKAANARKDVGKLSERHESTLRSVAITAISPPVFGLTFHPVGDDGGRAVIVVVPASVDAPHLLYRGEYFGAPVRNNADTVWMKERQIEAAYRARLDERRHSAEALDALYDEAAINWTDSKCAWLVAAAHPQIPAASNKSTRDTARAIFAAAKQNTLLYAGSGGIHPIESITHHNPRPGLRRWVAANSALSDQTKWRSSWAAVHHDGSVTLATSIGGQRTRSIEVGPYLVNSTGIETAVSDFMGIVRATSAALDLSAYDVRVGIVSGDNHVRIFTEDASGRPDLNRSTPLARFMPVIRAVIADASPLDFYWQVHDLAEDCVNQGGTSEVQMISPPPREGVES